MDYHEACNKSPDYEQKLEERILLRMQFIESVFEKIQSIGFFDNTYINRAVLFKAIESYFKELDRTKCFHNIDFADEHKKAAFTIKWLVKFRPVQLIPSCDDDSITSEHLLVNEVFAVFLAFVFLKVNALAISNVSVNYLDNLIYTLHYRDINEMVLSSMMYLLQVALENQSP